MSMLSASRIGIADQTTVAIRQYRLTAESVFVEAGLAERQLAAARRPLLWVAIGHTVAAAGAVATLVHGTGGPATQLLAAGTVGLGAAFWAVWGWSAVAPLPAAVVGLVMYASLSMAAAAGATVPAVQVPDWAPDAVWLAQAAVRAAIPIVAMLAAAATLGLLFRSVVIGTNARRLPGAGVPATGVVPVVLLYLALLFVVSHRAASAEDLLDAMRVVAFVVIAAALIGWRTVAPALARADGSWLVVGVLMGLGSFAFASLYLDGAAAAFGLSTGRGTDLWVVSGYGWAGSIAATVLFPAVFEELAFRGLIVPRLARVLGNGETAFVSAAMFAVLHLSPMSIPFLLPMGLGLAVLRRRSGSLWPCILMHLTHNAAGLAVAHWM